MKPCKYCGGKAEYLDHKDEETGRLRMMIHCAKCSAGTFEDLYGLYDIATSREDAVIEKQNAQEELQARWDAGNYVQEL